MTNLDKNYLLLQFKNRIYSKNATEFQSFFEDIMEKAFPNFKKIPSGGGDGGNDGWIKEIGRYYQVYAPNTPAVKDSEASKKLREDFKKLKENWNQISELKEYYFVFNDKYFGSKKPEEIIAILEKENPSIKFNLMLARELEDVFFQLDESGILSLGFNIDQRQAVSNAYKHLEIVELELDRDNSKYALKVLTDSKNILFEINDENLTLEYEILECRSLERLEKRDEAKEKYESISIRYPNEPRAFLYLAEIYLNDKQFDKNKELLEKAKKIDKNHWLLTLEELVRKIRLEEKIEVKNINENIFPDNSKARANYYRVYAPFFQESGDQAKAGSFIERAIHLNPDRFSNYITKLSLIEWRLFSDEDSSQASTLSQKLLDEIEKVENKFSEFGDIGARNKALLNVKKLNALRMQENYPEFEKISQETFKLSLICSFDNQIAKILSVLLVFVRLPDDDFKQLLEYLEQSKKDISEDLLKVLIVQFNIKDSLFTEGKIFFKEINNKKYLDFINDLESNEYKKILKTLNNDLPFAVSMANTLKNLPDLRRKIIENLPDDKNIQKEKIELLLNFDEKNFDDAFEILRNFDLSSLSYLECKPILKIIQEKKAWDFEIIVLEKLLKKEKDEKEIFNLEIQLFNAHLNLKKYLEVINIGEKLLKQDSDGTILDSRNKEALLMNTIIACFERGKFDKKALKKSQELLEEHPLAQPSFQFKTGIEAEVHLNNKEPELALKSAVEGVKIKKLLTPQEYANLYYLLCINIGNLLKLNLDSLNNVKENTFIKLKSKDQWHFIGDGNELDTIKIAKTNGKYSLYIDKKVGDKIVIEDKYSSERREEIVETIFSIEKYILWQSVQNFQKLSKDGLLDGVQMVHVPPKEGTIDPKYLLSFLEDTHKGTEPFFEKYCENNIPLAMLAVNEGGLVNAIVRIKQGNKGFINFSNGTIEELEKQKSIARKIIDKKLPFYLDGTSALFLSEIGLLKKIHSHIPNLKVPQSVISLLSDVAGKFTYTPGQTGSMGYAQGKIIFSPLEKDKSDLIHSKFFESIELLESKPTNISVISSANKADCFSEQEVPAELCDACILAQNENLPVLTEDFLYLTMNKFDTKKKEPEYFSSLALLRVLYEVGKISFDEYLDFFGYLSSYRFKFLHFNTDDIEKAVFGDGEIKKVNPENIRKLNFSLTLSEDYGVTFQNAFRVVGGFLLKVLTDNTVTSDTAEKIFIEIIETFPTKMSKRDFGQMLLRVCISVIEDNKSKFVYYPKKQIIHEKIDKLSQITEIFNAENKLWLPGTE